MISVTDLKNGKTFLSDNDPYVVLKYSHIKMGRGNAIIRVTVRNLRSGAIAEKTFTSGSVVEPVITIKKRLQYLYGDGKNAFFMDPQNYEQVEVDKKILGNQIAFLKEGQNVDILFWEDEPLGVDLPPKVTLAVDDTAPGVKGNSATNVYKPATLENGLQVKVPLFIKAGDKIRVDTRTGEYVERAK